MCNKGWHFCNYPPSGVVFPLCNTVDNLAMHLSKSYTLGMILVWQHEGTKLSPLHGMQGCLTVAVLGSPL